MVFTARQSLEYTASLLDLLILTLVFYPIVLVSNDEMEEWQL